MNSIYFAFLYPVPGLLAARDITAAMQSTAIALFNKEFVQKCDLRNAFETVTTKDAERLLP